jgi:hypothetical protein
MGKTPKSVMDVFKANPAKVFPSRNGFVYLQQQASVSQANLGVAASVDAGQAFNTRSQQAANRSGLLQ